MAALYALGALSQLEARAFEVHLRDGCPACELELKQFEEVAGLIGTTAQAVAPPAYLRDLLSVRLQRENSPAISLVQSSSTIPPSPVDSNSSDETASAEVISFREAKQAKATSVDSAGRIGSPAARPLSATAWLPWAVAAAMLIAFLYSFSDSEGEQRVEGPTRERSCDIYRDGTDQLGAKLASGSNNRTRRAGARPEFFGEDLLGRAGCSLGCDREPSRCAGRKGVPTLVYHSRLEDKRGVDKP
jgi:hypothetical protein